MTIGCYVLTDRLSGKFYVGSSGNVRKRIIQHISDLKRNNHHCPGLQAIWNKNGRLSETIFPATTREEAYDLEQDMIDRYSNTPELLNIVLQAKGGDTLTRHPNQKNIIAKIKESMIIRMNGLTKLEKKLLFGNSGLKNGMYGINHTEHAKKLMSDAHVGRIYRTGHTLSDEHKQLISNFAKIRIGELNPFYGRQHREDVRKKISETKKAQKLLPPNIRKVSIDGNIYESLTDASRKLNISPALMLYRLQSDKEKYSSYCYVT